MSLVEGFGMRDRGNESLVTSHQSLGDGDAESLVTSHQSLGDGECEVIGYR